jgi:hypothetical protein
LLDRKIAPTTRSNGVGTQLILALGIRRWSYVDTLR